MIVDSSALMAIINNEPEAQEFIQLLENSSQTFTPTPTAVEIHMVIKSNFGNLGVAKLNKLLKLLGISKLPFSQAHSDMANWAFDTYGKGSGSGAKLNFGDCMVYAAAKVEDMPLLFKGNDFLKTDISPPLAS